MDLVRSALAHAGEGQAAGDDRYMVHVVTHLDTGAVNFMDGRRLHPARAATLTCDASRVVHTFSESGEPLNVGRKSRDWSTAQRRAVAVRDGGHCRFVGCQNIHYDIHHIRPWEAGGATDVDNGCCVCPRHHHMIHRGYGVEGDPNGELRQYRPDGTYLGATYPIRRLVGV
jgi:hypothetical protein